MLDRKLQPVYQQVNDINFVEPQKQQLDNGIPVFTVNAGKQDLVRIEFIFENVNWDVSKPLQAITVSHLINNGTPELSAQQIAERIDYFGAFLQTEYGADQSTIKLYTLNKHLAEVLPILKAILTSSVFPEKELAIFIQNQRQSLQISLQKNDFLARKNFANAIFGDSAYGSNIEISDYEAIQQGDLLAYFKSAYTPQNCTIFVAGKFENAQYSVLNQIFGKDWLESVGSKRNRFSFEPNLKRDLLIDRPEAIQSAIRMGCLSINRTHVDFPGLQVLNCVLGGYFGSRLMANIREDKGFTYGVGSAVVSLRDAGYFFIATEVGADVCNTAQEEIFMEIKKLQSELVPDGELELVRNYMLGAMLGSLENAFSHADKFKNVYFSGLDYDYYQKYIETVKSISSEQLKDLAIAYLDLEHFTKVIVGKQ